MNIVNWDPVEATERELHARHALLVAVEAEMSPEDPPTVFEEMVHDLRETVSYRRMARWVAWDGDAMVGMAALRLQYTETNRQFAGFWVEVREDVRRQGLGRDLLRAVVEEARRDERTTLDSNAVVGGPGEPFLERLGAAKKLVERKSRLHIAELDLDMLHLWVDRAKERAADYSLVFWQNPAPDDVLEEFIRVTNFMNTAPRDDLEMEDWIQTPERYRESEALFMGQGYTGWKSCPRHDPSGAFAGFTELTFSPWQPTIAWQGGTAVDPTHRDRGLGRWLKADMLLRLLAERPEVEMIDTWNAGSNAPMLGINIALGFRPVGHFGQWQVATKVLAANLEAASAASEERRKS